MNAIKTKIAFAKGSLNFSINGTTVANVHYMESLLLDNWLKNNHGTIDYILPIGFKRLSVLDFLRWLVTVSSTFQDFEFDGSL